MRSNKAIAVFFSLSVVMSSSSAQQNAPEEGFVRGAARIDSGTDVLTKTIGLNPCRTLVAKERYDLAFQKAQEVINEQFSLELSSEFIKFTYDVVRDLDNKAAIKSTATLFDPSSSSDESAKSQAIELPDKKEVEKFVESFDAIKSACMSLKNRLEESVKRTPDNQNLNQLTALDSLIEYLVNVRTCYISYNVVSPYLYEAHRQAFIARGFFNDDEDALSDAAKLIGRGLHKTWLTQISGSVQEQYCEVIEYLHANLEEEEWEKLLVETTLVESLDKSKPRGGKAWLDEK